jgi:hypothetical protein
MAALVVYTLVDVQLACSRTDHVKNSLPGSDDFEILELILKKRNWIAAENG